MATAQGEISNRKRFGRWLAISILALVVVLFALPLLERMQMRFERTAFEQVVRQLNAACAHQVLLAKANEKDVLRDYLGANPMICLGDETLSGMVYIEQETSVEYQPEASWMFEIESGALRYKWRHHKQLISMGPEFDIVRYRLTAEFADTDQDKELDDDEIINGLYLKLVHSFQWHDSSQ